MQFNPVSPSLIKAFYGMFMRGQLVAVVALFLCVTPPAVGASSVIVVLGDSLSAGYGIDVEQGWVALVGRRLETETPPWRIVNASVSGDTTDGGLSRLAGVLDRHKPAVVVLELGANDGLRGQPPARIKDNIETMIAAVQASGAVPVVVGIRLPPNYGPRYLKDFEALFADTAAAADAPLVPFLLDGVAAVEGMMQPDGLHPTVAAQPKIVENVWPAIEKAREMATK